MSAPTDDVCYFASPVFVMHSQVGRSGSKPETRALFVLACPSVQYAALPDGQLMAQRADGPVAVHWDTPSGLTLSVAAFGPSAAEGDARVVAGFFVAPAS